MEKEIRNNVIFLVVLIIIITLSAVMSDQVERDFGKIDVSTVNITTAQDDVVAAKLFRPQIATPDNPVPAIVNMHGYQNDKGVQDSFSIELAKRGFVVIAPDALGHGDSEGNLNVMRWFMDPFYVMGNEDGLSYLIQLPFVQSDKIGVMGHSMGGMNAAKLPGLFPGNVVAVVLQASIPGRVRQPNLLMLQARYDELAIFRENELRTEKLTSNEERLAVLGFEDPIEWDITYGSFVDGTARRMALIHIDHHLMPLASKSVAESVMWMNEALRDGDGGPMWSDPTSQTFMVKEIFGLMTLIGTLVSLLPITNLLLQSKFFAPVAQPLPQRYHVKKRKWWLYASVNMLVIGVLYPLTTQFGGIGNRITELFPFLKMEMANGITAFYLASAVLGIILFSVWFLCQKKAGMTLYDMGVTFDEEQNKINWVIIGRTVLLGLILFMWMYLLVSLSQSVLGQEFRFAFPYMRRFGQPRRVGYFFIYLIPALLFWLINGGIFLFGLIRQKQLKSPWRTHWIWWLKNAYAMVTGLFLLCCFQYLPWIFGGPGPGLELAGLAQFSDMTPMILFGYIPLFIVMIWFLTWFFRKTGKIYLGSLLVASITIWFLTAGSIIAM